MSKPDVWEDGPRWLLGTWEVFPASDGHPGLRVKSWQAVVIEWLDSMGVLCDCNNGMRVYGSGREQGECVECALVEVGGIRMRALRGIPGMSNGNMLRLWVERVEVTDEV